MKVICKHNNLNVFNQSTINRLRKYIFMPDGEIDLVIGQDYMVYGIVFRDNSPWYYICVEDYDEYPKPFPAECFEVINSKLSNYWRLSTRNIYENLIESSLLINYWSENENFYELLVDGDPDIVEQFIEYKLLIDAE